MFGSHVLPDGRLLLRCHYMDTDRVFVAGDFSGWAPIDMEPDQDGWWRIVTAPLDPGSYRYRFTTQGTWFSDQFNMRTSPEGRDSLLHVGEGHGHLLRRSFCSPRLEREKRYCIYLPPGYPHRTDERFPCLVLLPGLLDDEMTWSRRAHVEHVADRLVAEGRIPRMVIVCPDKDDTMFDEASWHLYGSYLADDLLEHLEATYRLIPDGSSRAIEGLSLGGAWAIRLAAWHPERYRSVAGLSCAFSGDLVDVLTHSATTLAARQVRFRLAYGHDEGPVLAQATGSFAGLLRSLGLSCEVSSDPGPHDWPLWSIQLPHSLAFHAWSFTHTARAENLP